MLVAVLVIVGLVVLIGLYAMSVKNKLVDRDEKVKNSWSQIEVVLQERGDLIPNLVATVKGYSKHEAETLESVVQARRSTLINGTPQEAMDANNEISGALSRLLMVSESYPELKANTNFLKLQDTIQVQENKISKYRQFYNDTILIYNRIVGQFPSGLFASMFGYHQKEYLKAPEASKEVPKVEF